MEDEKKENPPRLSATLSSFYIFLLKCLICFSFSSSSGLLTSDLAALSIYSPGRFHSGETGGNLRRAAALAKGDPCLQWNIGGDYNKASRGGRRMLRAQRATPSVPETLPSIGG